MSISIELVDAEGLDVEADAIEVEPELDEDLVMDRDGVVLDLLDRRGAEELLERLGLLGVRRGI